MGNRIGRIEKRTAGWAVRKKTGRNEDMNEMAWANEVSEKIKKKVRKVAERSCHKIPFTTENGVHSDESNPQRICWWTNGFWGGMMWQLYNATQDPIYKEAAEWSEEKLDGALMNAAGMDHDSGFRWLPTAGANYRLTKNPESLNRIRLAADNFAGRFNYAGKFFRAWNNWDETDRTGWAIIDCMMNLPLLYWMAKELKDPRYDQIARMHADTAMKHFIRENGSSKHIICFDPATGEYLRSLGGQGYGVGSSWTRGQSWALYGFTLSYMHTKDENYLETAKKCAEYFISNIPEDGLIPVDFDQPADCTWKDCTAAAIASCGLLELEKLVDKEAAKKYHDAAIRMLKALDEKDCNWDENADNLLEKCTGAYHDQRHEYPIIYGDYYFVEAIWKLTGQELFIW